MKKINKKDWFTIPNILCYIRIILVPIFIVVYLHSETSDDYLLSAAIIALSGLTDMFDGMIARKFNQITELGKFLDPLADKLTQCALVFCMSTRYFAMWLLVVLFIIKEGSMATMGVIMLKHNGHKLDGAQWFGKICTAILYISMLILLLIPQINLNLANAIIIACGVIMLITTLLYRNVFKGMWSFAPNKKETNV